MSKPTPIWRRYLRLFGADPHGDVADELQFHIDERTDQLIAQEPRGWGRLARASCSA